MDDLRIENGVALVRLAAGKANAVSRELLATLNGVLDRLPESGATSVVITGYDRYFSAGLALPTLLDLDRAAMRQFITGFNDTMLRLFSCPLPVVAAINGHAIAGGCVLALQADQRIMAAGNGQIGLNEVQLGIGMPTVVIETLRFHVPASSLLPIAQRGLLVGVERALELGLIDEVVSAEGLLAAAVDRARQLGAVPSGAFAQVKLALRRPTVDLISRLAGDETERWLDTWFSLAARERLQSAVRRIEKR